jgi:hypothetical protein
MSSNSCKDKATDTVGEHSLSLKKKSVPVTGPVIAQRAGIDIALLFHDHGTRRE